MFEILTVCTGNICRSPLAELLLTDALADLGAHASSAGTAPLADMPMPDEMQAIAVRLGVGADAAAAHRSHVLTADDLVTPDLILGMSRNHRRKIARLAPIRVSEAFTLREFARLASELTHGQIRDAAAAAGTDAGARVRAVSALVASRRGLSPTPHELSDDDVVDPYRRSAETYELATQQLTSALEVVVRVLRIALTPAHEGDPAEAEELIGGTVVQAPAAEATPEVPTSHRTRRRRSSSHSHPHGDAGRRRRRRWVPWIIGAVGGVVLLVAVAAVMGVLFLKQAQSAQADLMAAKAKIGQVTTLMKADDSAGLQQVAADVQTLTKRALKTTSGPLWNIAAAVPFVGVNISAVQKTTEAADILVDGALPPAVRLMSTMQAKQLKLKGGGISLKPFEQAQKDLPGINAAFAQAQSTVGGIDRDSLLPPVRDAIGGLLDIIDEATPTLKTVQRILPTLLPMAGSDGPRNYLLIFQNNAEMRATGGNPSASAQIRVDHGRITLGAQASTATFSNAGTVRHEYVDLPQKMRQIYQADTTWYPQNYTRTPDFPTTAKLFDGLWRATTHQKLDGVISVDPVVLSHVLHVTGPVTVAGDRLTAKNVVKKVLSDAYERFPKGTDSDAYFAEVASAVFAKVTSGDWDPAAMLTQLQESAQEQRLYAWFPAKSEQALAAEAGIDGALTTTNAQHTQVGIFLNDYTVGKLQYWLTSKVNVTCDADKRTVTTSIDISNRIPSADFSNYTLGWRDGRYGQPRTTMLMDVLFFAPPGASISKAQTTGDQIPSLARSGIEKGHAAKSVTVIVPKGQTRTVSFTSTLAKGAVSPISVRHTPTVTDTPVTIAHSCDGF
ncbi:DUF4012 domain-containing protein [Microbacterium terrisoli]|uniref:DUF4012 domain-containing protein n=1 Tax=Microbacterium terrisoli TaxID=3242192 RepID=UPI0028065874|nr:DUF4012 domain-containing protein [Microbacterium protaetiae]